MDKVGLLCAMNRFMMEEFSRHTIENLKAYNLFRVMLPSFKSFLSVNLEKEVEKDCLVLNYAASAAVAGKPPDHSGVKKLLLKAREIDQVFVQKVSIFPIAITIRYHDIELIRQQRIELQLKEAYQLLLQWKYPSSFRTSMAELYTREQFSDLLGEVLRLYSMETQMLSKSIQIPRILTFARDSLGQTLHSVMERSAVEVTTALCDKVY